jgi:hypothetical protein
MAEITSDTSLEELAAMISQILESAGILATLSGGAAVSIYTNNRYQSQDLDFVSLPHQASWLKLSRPWASCPQRHNGCSHIHKLHGSWSFQPDHLDLVRRS